MYLVGTLLEPWEYWDEAPAQLDNDDDERADSRDPSVRSDISAITLSDSEGEGEDGDDGEEVLLPGYYEDELRGCDWPVVEEVGESRMHVIITMMSTHPDCFPLQLEAVRLVHRMSYSTAHRHLLRYSRIVAAVVRALSIWSTSDDLLEQGFGYLHNILNDEDQQRCLERGILEDEDALLQWNNSLEDVQKLVPLDLVMIGIERCQDPNSSPFTFVLSLALYRDIEGMEKYYNLLLSIANKGGDASLELVDHLCQVYHLNTDLYQLRDDEACNLLAEATRALHLLLLNIGEEGHPTQRGHFTVEKICEEGAAPWMTPNPHWLYYSWNEVALARVKRFVLTEGVEKLMLAMKRNPRVIQMQWSSFELLSQIAFLPRVKADLSDYGLFNLWIVAVKQHLMVRTYRFRLSHFSYLSAQKLKTVHSFLLVCLFKNDLCLSD